MNIDRLDSLINIIEAGNATNVSEAIAYNSDSLNSQ